MHKVLTEPQDLKEIPVLKVQQDLKGHKDLQEIKAHKVYKVLKV